MESLNETIPALIGESGEDGLSQRAYERICMESALQPNWRSRADKCCEYYDGHQIDADTKALLDERGMGDLVSNLIRPTIDMVLGMEAKTRSDWRVIADDDKWQDVAEAQSARLHESERETRADRACSDAYASQIKAGLGWVEVSRVADPFKYRYRVRSVHRSEIDWDWRSSEPDLSDAAWLRRTRWTRIDEATAYFQDKRDLILAASAGWSTEYIQRAQSRMDLANAFDNEARISLYDYQWRNSENNTVALSEVLYRVFKRGLVMTLPDGRVVEVDQRNPIHQVAIATGRVRPEMAVYSTLKSSIWLGPHKLRDNVETKRLPYIPFFGYREDLTGEPYGLIRGMLSPQDEVNARRRKLYWLLASRRIEMDSDALDTAVNSLEDVMNSIASPEGVVVKNPDRKNADGWRVDNNIALSNQQYELLTMSKSEIQEAAGVFNSMLGRTDNASSGLAINSLIDQGTTTLAEINDNYRTARRYVGEALLELIVDDMVGKPVQVMVGEVGKRKSISLNTPSRDPDTGIPVLDNDVSRARTKVALEDVPSTPAYRAQQQTMLAEVMKSFPPEIQAILAPFYLESTELSKRREMADLLRKRLGQEDEADPEKQRMMQVIEQLRAALQQAQTAPQLKEIEAKINKLMADARLTQAKAVETVANTLIAVNNVEAQERAEAQAGNDGDGIEKRIESTVFAS